MNKAAWGGRHGHVQKDVQSRHDVGIDPDLVQHLICRDTRFVENTMYIQSLYKHRNLIILAKLLFYYI